VTRQIAHSRRPAARAALIAAVISVTLALALPAESRASCGQVRVAEPAHRHGHDRPPLAIGDSTMLLALYDLAAVGYEANAHGCRQFPEALALLRQRRAEHTLPHMVVIALGADGAVTHDDIGEAFGLLCCTHLLVLVTPRELGGGSGADAAIVRQQVQRHSNRALLLDWVKDSEGHGDWFQPDGIHLTTAGALAFTALLRTALRDAYPAHKRRRVPCRGRPVDSHAATARAAAAPLTLTASLARTGYVGARIAGPQGASVQLSERVHHADKPLAVVQLATGRATVPQALRWACAPRKRELRATTLPPSRPEQAIAHVVTPSCTRRLRTAIARSARVGAAITIRLRDRWGIGALPIQICVTPPGGPAACSRWWVHRDEPRRTISIPAPRPGGWEIAVTGLDGRTKERLSWAEHPGGRIRLLAVGDSEMQVLDDLLAQDLGAHGVDVTKDARISTGLTKPFFFDWQGHARQQAATLRPDATVMFIGANDGFSVTGPRGAPVPCCGPSWSTGYANLVAQMMRTYSRGNAGRVYWFVLPAPRPGSFSGLFGSVDAGIRQAARRFPGRVQLIDAYRFFTPGGYRDFMTYHGQGFVIHEPDGVHLSTSADGVAAGLVVDQMRADHLIR
jgi:lysophospholipase L1-like esterase